MTDGIRRIREGIDRRRLGELRDASSGVAGTARCGLAPRPISSPAILADAVLFTWLFNRTGGSLVPVLVFHASIAVTGLYLVSSGHPMLEPTVKWAAVALVVWYDGPTLHAE